MIFLYFPMQRSKSLYITLVLLFGIINKAVVLGCNTLNNHLIYAQPEGILKVDPIALKQEYCVRSRYPTSFDYDFKRNSLIWTEHKNNQIFTQANNSTSVNILIPNKSNWMPISISVNSVNSKLYVVDEFADTVGLFDQENLTKQGIIIGSNVSKIKSIALDPHEGYLFILDQYQILRTELDGSNQKVIYSELDLDSVYNTTEVPVAKKRISLANIALDFKTKRLYWINTITATIESSDYNGENQMIVYQNENHSQLIYSIAILNGDLYWVNFPSKQLIKYDLRMKKVAVVMKNVMARIIKSIEYEPRQKTSNLCDKDNGKCHHFCILSRKSKKQIKCSCNVGYQLGNDGKSCIASKDFLLIEQNELLRGKSLGSDGYITADIINPSQFEVGTTLSLDFDAMDRLILYSSLAPQDQLHVVHLDNQERHTLLPDLLSKSVGKMAYDWITKNIYYFTYYYSDMITLNVVNVNNPTYSKILIEGVNGIVRGITIHPNRGYIYYIIMANSACTIYRINTDGSGLKKLKNVDSEDLIEGLALDYNQDRLYYTESYMVRNGTRIIQIRECNLDGRDIHEILKIESFEGNIVSMAVHEQWLYLNTGSILYRLNLRNGVKLIILLQDMKRSQSLSNIKVFNRTIQTIAAGHPCVTVANRCEKFCFAILDLNGRYKGICGCPYGEKLGEDGKSCVDNSQQEPPFMPCTDGRPKCRMSKAIV